MALPFLAIDYGLTIKALRTLVLVAVCIGIEIFLFHHQPQIYVEHHILIAMRAVNIFMFLVGTSILTYLYTLANISAREKLSNLASIDPLTGLKNRRSFNTFLKQELFRAKRYDHPVSVLIIDIDFFKRVNDSFGHDAGDRLLSGLAKFLDNSVRSTDLLARYGGEEFVVVLPQTDLTQAMEFGERLRKTIESHGFDIEEGRQTSITASIGVAEFPGNADTREGLIKSADNALYAAKEAGRNNVKAAGED